MRIEIAAGNEKLDMIRSDIRDYRRVLNMKTGELTRSFTWITASGEEIDVKFSRFASLDEKRLFVQQADLKPRKERLTLLLRVELMPELLQMVTVILQNPACLKKRIKLVLQLRQMLEKEHLLCVKISCVV